jgi:feruloyl esterase
MRHSQENEMMKLGWVSMFALFTAVFSACAVDQATTGAASDRSAPISGPEACIALASLSGAALGEPTARIESATFNPPSPAREIPGAPPWMSTFPALPEHCEVAGVMRERTGTDGQHYRVRFRMRLPSDWNGRFLYEGGGGTNGDLGLTVGGVTGGGDNALDRGFAIVSTDTGHDNKTNVDPARQGQVAFAHDYEARLEYAEKALDSVATAGKRIVAAYYGRPADRNYFAGCSNGGREGMVFAQRFPEQFDGIVASAPAFTLPKAGMATAWDTQVFSELARSTDRSTASGMPDLAMTYSAEDLGRVAEAVLDACDALDGLRDGMVQRLAACTTRTVEPELRERQCDETDAGACLSEAQIDALVASLEGPRDSSGASLYSVWPWDTGIATDGWRVWKIGIPEQTPAINIMLGAPTLSGLFISPPDVVPAMPDALQQYQLDFDFDQDPPRIYATTPEFPRSSWDLVAARSTELDAFRDHGGRMLVPHGGSDPIFSLYDTTAWWDELDRAEGGNAAEFVRVYAVPGMTHCGGGPATGEFDALGTLVDWVEHGKAPNGIEATAGPDTPWPGRTRPLCPYPTYAHYTGGDSERAPGFTCRE